MIRISSAATYATNFKNSTETWKFFRQKLCHIQVAAAGEILKQYVTP